MGSRHVGTLARTNTYGQVNGGTLPRTLAVHSTDHYSF